MFAQFVPEMTKALTHGHRGLSAAASGLTQGLLGAVLDTSSVEGSADTEYELPALRVEYYRDEPGIPVGPWRSVGHSFNAFVMDGFVDELAHAAKRDPLELRRSLLKYKHRSRWVLEAVAAKAGWASPPPAGLFRGIACHKSFDSYSAAVAEVAIVEGQIQVKRVVIGIDCGQLVNPDVVAAQLESAVLFGLSAALKGKITLENGGVVQSNFHDYELLRMFEAPKIETVLVQNEAAPTGVGEPGVPVIAPAVANAVFAATGKRLRVLPLSLAEGEAT
jgi:isoquinoline 1-oxidoreductase subunit beta